MSQGLKGHLKKLLPPGMVPGNVGHVNEVMWPFFHLLTFDFGTNPTWSFSSRSVQSFQVTQEACLLLTKVTRKSYSYDTAGELAPLQFVLRDRQSSRQLNDRPIPLQIIGKKSRPTVLPTPYLVMPNAFIEVEMTSWVPSGSSMAATGNGKHELVFEGYRIRIEDQDKVLSTIFG